MFNFSTISPWEICKSSPISPLTFCLFKSWAAQTVDWPSSPRLVIQVQISATFPYFLISIYTNSICTTERQLNASKFQREFHFCASRTQQERSIFYVLWHSWEWVTNSELSTVQTTMITKPYQMANWDSRNNKWGWTNTASTSHCLREILEQRHCSQSPTCILDRLAHKRLTDFLLAASISTLKITKPDVKGNETAKVTIL